MIHMQLLMFLLMCAAYSAPIMEAVVGRLHIFGGGEGEGGRGAGGFHYKC